MARIRKRKSSFFDYQEKALTPIRGPKGVWKTLPGGRHDSPIIKEMTDYERYMMMFETAKRKGWRFKEGASELLDRRNFTATANMYQALVGEIDKGTAQVIFEEQLMVQPESIAQAVMLWNEHSNLVSQYGPMDANSFRDNEAEAFAILRAQYPDKKSYDMAMSY
jgi:trans-aconitate methyltransferase